MTLKINKSIAADTSSEIEVFNILQASSAFIHDQSFVHTRKSSRNNTLLSTVKPTVKLPQKVDDFNVNDISEHASPLELDHF